MTHVAAATDHDAASSRTPRTLPQASVGETLQVVGTIVAPLLARGVIKRRPAAVRVAEKLDADRKGVRLLQRLHRTHGLGPLRLRIPGRRMVVLLDPQHVHRVLAESPEPFSPATREKRAALAHFQPHGVLISSPDERAHRRRFNEEVLDASHGVHRDADVMIARIREEIDGLQARAVDAGALTWPQYAEMWGRMVRRVVLGEGAKDDEDFADDLTLLRATANWAFLHPRRRRLRARFERRLHEHVARAEPGSLAGSMPFAPTTDVTDPEQQVPQWLFAFDAAAWASFRALALLHSHPEQMARAREEVAGLDLSTPQSLPYLRACLLESLRLWPTTPAVLRESVTRTQWERGPMPEDTSILTYAPYFHRDDRNLPDADRFAPDIWLTGERSSADWPLIPFSAGPAECPGRNLVLHVSSTILGLLISGPDLELADPGRVGAPDRLVSVLDPFSLTFRTRSA